MALVMARPWKHPKTGVYWLRKAVPKELRAIVGKLDEKKTLGTKEPAEAKRLHASALADLEAQWAQLRDRLASKPSRSAQLSEREAHELQPGCMTFGSTRTAKTRANKRSGGRTFTNACGSARAF